MHGWLRECVHITEMTQLRFIQIEARVYYNGMTVYRPQLKSFLFKLVQLLSAYTCPRAISLCSGFVDSLTDDPLVIKIWMFYCILLHCFLIILFLIFFSLQLR